MKLDQNGNVVVADTANNRVLEFAPNAKSSNRVWGQSDFVSNGANQIKPASVNIPYRMAIDYSSAPFALYVSDTANNRVLVWKDSVVFETEIQPTWLWGSPICGREWRTWIPRGRRTPRRRRFPRHRELP